MMQVQRRRVAVAITLVAILLAVGAVGVLRRSTPARSRVLAVSCPAIRPKKHGVTVYNHGQCATGGSMYAQLTALHASKQGMDNVLLGFVGSARTGYATLRSLGVPPRVATELMRQWRRSVAAKKP